MELINFIFRLGVVFAIFGFIWGILQIGYNLLRAGSKKSIGEDYLIKTVKYFFLVDVTSIFCFDNELNMNQLIITALILLTYFIGKLQNQQNKIVMFQMIANGIPKQEVKFDLKTEVVVIIISIGFFIGFIFFPQYTQNPVSVWFHDSIINIENTPIFGFIFKVIGFIFIINLFFKMLNGFSQIITGKPLTQTVNNKRNNKDSNDETKFDDFEELN